MRRALVIAAVLVLAACEHSEEPTTITAAVHCVRVMGATKLPPSLTPVPTWTISDGTDISGVVQP